MQVLFIILGALVVIVLGLFVFSLFLSSRIKIERTLIMKARPEVVFQEVDNLHNWERWSPWHRLDPHLKIVYGEKERGAGASYSWESRKRKVGSGSITITESRPYEYIAININFQERSSARGYFRFEPAGEGSESTRVTWGMEMDMGNNPANKLMGIMLDKWVGRDYEKGLQQLATAAERN